MTIKDGFPGLADEVMNSYGLLFRATMNTIWQHDLAGWDSKLEGTGTPTFKNITYDSFKDETKTDTVWNFEHDSTNKLYKTPTYDSSTVFWCIIEADSISSISDFEINDCSMLQIATGKWILYETTSGSLEVSMAQVMKTLMYGTAGTDPRATSTYITNCTALKINRTDWVGYRMHYMNIYAEGSNKDADYTGDFDDVTTNTKCRAWSRVRARSGTTGASWSEFEFPLGTVRNSANSGGGGDVISDETGTDTSADEVSNPTDTKLDGHVGGSLGVTPLFDIDAIFLAKGTMSNFILTDPDTIVLDNNHTDFIVDHSMPTFTDGSSDSDMDNSTIISTLTTGASTITNSISTWDSAIDATSSEVFSVSYDNGTTWEACTKNSIERATPTGTQLKVKWVVTRTDLTKEDKIYQHGTAYSWY